MLYTNSASNWSHVVLKHPASFQTLAMDPEKNKEIMEDLTTFNKGEEFFERLERAWKRGYLYYGPLGIGKSSMIAAIVSFESHSLFG